jgi:hypothetical protein
MRPISVVAASAPRYMYVQYIPFRCSAAPRIWTTWSTNLSPTTSGKLLGGCAYQPPEYIS